MFEALLPESVIDWREPVIPAEDEAMARPVPDEMPFATIL